MTHVDGAAAFSAHCAELGIADTAKQAVVQLLGRHATSFAKFAIDHRA